MTICQDLVRFNNAGAGASGSGAAGTPPQLQLVEVRSLAPSVFASCDSAERVRAMLKRVRFVHMPTWWVDAGLARLLADEKCVMVVGLSDLLEGSVSERAKRLARAKKMAELVLHFGGRVRVCSMARNEREVRNGLELLCAAEEIGMNLKQAKMEMERKIVESGMGRKIAG